MDEIFNKDALPARDQVDSWADIRKNIGDKVSGIFQGYWEDPAREGFGPKIGVALKQQDGTVVGVTLSDTPYMRDAIHGAIVGDRLGFRYEADKDTGKPQPAKIIRAYNPDRTEREKTTPPPQTAPQTAPQAPVQDHQEDQPF